MWESAKLVLHNSDEIACTFAEGLLDPSHGLLQTSVKNTDHDVGAIRICLPGQEMGNDLWPIGVASERDEPRG